VILHCGIIHHDGELIGRNIIGSPNHEVAEIFSSNELLRAVMTVTKEIVWSSGTRKRQENLRFTNLKI